MNSPKLKQLPTKDPTGLYFELCIFMYCNAIVLVIDQLSQLSYFLNIQLKNIAKAKNFIKTSHSEKLPTILTACNLQSVFKVLYFDLFPNYCSMTMFF